MIGLPTDLTPLFDTHLGDCPVKLIENAAAFERLIEHFTVEAGTACYVSTELGDIGHLEVAQGLSSCFPGISLVFVTRDRSQFDLEILKKNGFTDFVLLPHDHESLVTGLQNARQSSTGGLARRFKAVQIVDLRANEQLPFNVFAYLPMNDKYVSLCGSGQLSTAKFEKMKSQSMKTIYIDDKETDKFFEFAAEKLYQLGQSGNDAVTETEKAERLQTSVRDLFRTILDSGSNSDFSKGRDLANSAAQVVEVYLKKKVGTDLAERLKFLVGDDQGSAYSSAQAVSAVACLLSLATGIGTPEDLAIAGLFANIGCSEEATEEGSEQSDHKHPERSLNLLKEKKVSVSEEVGEIIEKHHERTDGKGFPKALSAHRIPLTAQLLRYAELIESRTRRRRGKVSPDAKQAHEMIARMGGFSDELLGRIKDVLR